MIRFGTARNDDINMINITTTIEWYTISPVSAFSVPLKKLIPNCTYFVMHFDSSINHKECITKSLKLNKKL